jgi:phenylacetate-CoA ligase
VQGCLKEPTLPDWLKIYHKLPYPMRVAAASARGYYLRSWRYGKETEGLIAEARKRECWSAAQWKAWQEERLSYVLHRAATQVPFYRRYWSDRKRNGDKPSWEYIENWPILGKDVLRAKGREFLADGCDVRKMFHDSTSGTTGTPLSLYSRRETVRKLYALFETRWRRWHGVSGQEHWAIMGGQLVVPFHQNKPPFWVYNAGLNQLYLSTHHVSLENAKYYVGALLRFRTTHMVVYPSSAIILASAILEQRLEPPPLKVIISNAELLTDQQREVLSTAFRCPVRNTYGMAENVVAASECECGNLHLWPEVGFIEVFSDEDDTPTGEGKTGRIVGTSLLNGEMPLIRYETGDRGCLSEARTECSCGRKMQILERVEGRSNDLIVTQDGRKIFWFNPVFHGLKIIESQIVQERIDAVKVLIVVAPGFSKSDETVIVKRLRDRLGDMSITIERRDSIPRAANGKFKAVVSLIDR